MTMPLVNLATSGFILFAARSFDRKSKFSKTFARAQLSGVPLKIHSRVKLKRLTREHISKNISKSSKISDYTRRAHVLRDVTHSVKVHLNTRAKGTPMKTARGSIILHFERPTSRKNNRSNRFRGRDKLGRTLVCCDM